LASATLALSCRPATIERVADDLGQTTAEQPRPPGCDTSSRDDAKFGTIFWKGSTLLVPKQREFAVLKERWVARRAGIFAHGVAATGAHKLQFQICLQNAK
jgi:hypothetical protein